MLRILLQASPIEPLSFIWLALSMVHQFRALEKRRHVAVVDRNCRAQVLLSVCTSVRTFPSEQLSVRKVGVGILRIDPVRLLKRGLCRLSLVVDRL